MRGIALKSIVTTLLICSFTIVNAQQTSKATLGSINRTTPKFGFNGTGYVPPSVPNKSYIGANWTQQWFIDSTIYLNPEILRYPGGTNSNHWDWQTGWYRAGYAPPTTPLTLRAEEFKPALVGSNAEGLFVLNLETSTPNYEMNALRHYSALGLNPNLFELGNEHNLANATYPLQDMTSTNYAQLAKTYYDSVKVVFPNSKVCVVGGALKAHPNWHTDILNKIPNIDAFAFHVYIVANNADLAFRVNRALAIPFGTDPTNSSTLLYRYVNGGFSTLNKEVWVTEYNLEETQVSSVPVIAKTWTHTLYVTAMNHFFLSKSNISMVLNHGLASVTDHYPAISNFDKHITASGVGVKLLSDMARGSSSCQDIAFSGSNSMTYGIETIPKLVGWKFNHAGNQKGFICNFSKDTIKVSLSSVFANTIQFDQYYADTAFVVKGLSSVSKYSGSTTDSVSIYPFSFTQITTSIATGINTQANNNNDLWIFPNPTNNTEITIKSGYSLQNAEIVIYNVAGQIISRIASVNGNQVTVPINKLAKGMYLISVNSADNNAITKFVVD